MRFICRNCNSKCFPWENRTRILVSSINGYYEEMSGYCAPLIDVKVREWREMLTLDAAMDGSLTRPAEDRPWGQKVHMEKKKETFKRLTKGLLKDGKYKITAKK